MSDVKESYHNMNILFQLTNLNEVEYKLSQDLKLTSIIIGITSHSSKYPCPYGECFKDNHGNWVKGKDRTVKNLTENQMKWCENSMDRKYLKKYKNCNNVPLITSEEETPILYLIPPPPLHTLLLGPVNDVIKKLQSLHPNLIKILEQLHIQRSKYHGRNFEGNQCRNILKNIKKLEIPNELKEFENFLFNLKVIYKVSNSQLLPHNYCQVIDNFSESWLKLSTKYKLSTTPKIHIVLHHLCDYFDETNLTLVKVSDEIVENCHQLFHKRFVKGFVVKDLKHSALSKKLFNAVRSFNTYNLKIKN